jgi:hypothetical protein
MPKQRLKPATIVAIVEAILSGIFAAGLGLIIGAIHPIAGVGAAMVAIGVIGMGFVLAADRGD